MEFYYHEVDSDVLILSADGGLNAQTAAQFTSQIEKLVDAGLTKIIVDCQKLKYITSAGISVILKLHSRLKDQGGEVKVCNVRSIVAHALEATRLNTLFEIYPDVDRALLAFRPKQV